MPIDIDDYTVILKRNTEYKISFNITPSKRMKFNILDAIACYIIMKQGIDPKLMVDVINVKIDGDTIGKRIKIK